MVSSFGGGVERGGAFGLKKKHYRRAMELQGSSRVALVWLKPLVIAVTAEPPQVNCPMGISYIEI